jgi:serine phosphatase RsbU (regulator of sigma subunit)/anti-sigma regulatory factor (Ser/Thr protein kinase)
MSDSIPAERGVSNRVVFRCDLSEARVATRILRAFLAEQGLDETEQFNCELCLAEACNNAVQYARPESTSLPIAAEVICHASGVELRVTDHTPGVELGDRAPTITPDRENGRGLFIIQAMMDEVSYYRGREDNTLVMRKRRTHQQHNPTERAATASLEDLRRQLESCQQSIGGMARELCFRSESLAAIFRCCAELGRSSDLEGFGHRLLNDLLHLTGSDWFVLRLLPTGDTRLAVFAVSSPELRSEPLVLQPTEPADAGAELAAALARVEVEFDARRAPPTAEPLAAIGPTAHGLVQPLLFGETLLGTLAIGHRKATDPYSALQAEMIRIFSEFMAVQVANARYQEEKVHARLVAHELEIAHRIQRALLPRTLPHLAGFRLAANWESARQVGGDFYDAVPLSDHSMLLVVADVMGKGVPAAIFSTIMRSLVRAMAVRSHHPARLLRRLNELLYPELSSVGMFITAQLVFVDLKKRQIAAASAGHCPVLLASGDSVRALRVTGTPLGILPNSTYRQQTASFTRPAGLLLYTDGLTESINAAGEMFGTERLVSWTRAHLTSAVSAEGLRDALVTELATFRGNAPLRDDQAFLLLAEDQLTATLTRPAALMGQDTHAAELAKAS